MRVIVLFLSLMMTVPAGAVLAEEDARLVEALEAADAAYRATNYDEAVTHYLAAYEHRKIPSFY